MRRIKENSGIMIDRIDKLLDEIEKENARTPQEIEALRIKYLSRKGIINDLMSDFREVPQSLKKKLE